MSRGGLTSFRVSEGAAGAERTVVYAIDASNAVREARAFFTVTEGASKERFAALADRLRARYGPPTRGGRTGDERLEIGWTTPRNEQIGLALQAGDPLQIQVGASSPLRG